MNRIITPEPIHLPSGGLNGRFLKFETFKGVEDMAGNVHEIPGTRKLHAGESKNLILNQGLDYIGNSGTYLAACQVGTSNAAPANAQTGLSAYLVGTSTTTSSTYAAASGSPYYGKVTIVYRFGVGVAAGNLSEVGVGKTSATGSLFSRALIVDGGGTPTTITVLSDEYLDVTYELRNYVPLVDVTGSVTLNAISRNYTIRAIDATNSQVWARGLGVQATGNYSAPGGGAQSPFIYTGALVAIAGANVAGQIGGYLPDTKVDTPYVNGNHWLNCKYEWVPGNGTHTSIKTHLFVGSLGSYQMEFSPVLNKTAPMVLNHTFRWSWARHP